MLNSDILLFVQFFSDLAERDICALCKQPLNDDQRTSVLTKKGVAGLQKANRARGASGLDFYPGQILHIKCRHDYCNAQAIKRDLRRKGEQSTEAKKTSLRSSHSKFDFANDCLLCGRSIVDQRKKGNISVYPVRTASCQASLELMCLQRGPGDKWAETVKGRIEYAQDLHAADAVYHQQCNINFRTGRNIPLAFQPPGSESKNKKGRPEDEDRHAAFSKVVSYLKENDDEIITLGDLCQKMREFLGGDEPYSKEHMKNKLVKTLNEDIVITNIQGKDSVVSIRVTAEKILDQFWTQQKQQSETSEKFMIIHTAAKLIQADVRELQYTKEFYPTREVIGDIEDNLNYLPASLVLFLQSLVYKNKETKLKTASIGQAIMQAMRPNSFIPPLQIGLGVQLHHLHGSRALVDLLHSLGFCSSYHEVQIFEKSAASSQGTALSGVKSDSFIQFAADNVDHNIRTLEGLGTFHGMGIIGAATPSERLPTVIRRDSSITALQTSTLGQIPVRFFNSSKTDISLKYQELKNFRFEDITKNLDLLWKVSWPLRTPRIGWSGLMQTVSEGSYPGQSAITFLPMIDMQPTNMTCIYSTLHFVSNLAAKYKY